MTGAGQSCSDGSLPDGGLNWLAPARLLCTTRAGGESRGPYASNNLALHVDDEPKSVLRNRSQLSDLKGITSIQWLHQVHGTRVIEVDHVDQMAAADPTADALFTTRPGIGLAILTADCLPVVVVDTQGEVAAAAHAGWRGLCAGILGVLINALPVPNGRLRAFIGPAIGAGAFEVGAEVVQALDDCGLNLAGVSAQKLDTQGVQVRGKFQVDLAQAARVELHRLGVAEVTGGNWCTAEDQRFYSWRRETHRAAAAGERPATGRQTTLVWLPAQT